MQLSTRLYWGIVQFVQKVPEATKHPVATNQRSIEEGHHPRVLGEGQRLVSIKRGNSRTIEQF